MIYHRVGNFCAFTLKISGIKISEKTILSILLEKDFEIIDVDIVEQARKLIGLSKYHRSAPMSVAPLTVDCGSLIKWLYSFRGIWLPRNLLLWQKFSLKTNKIIGNDLIFTTHRNSPDINHVAIASGPDTIIHATNHIGVEEIKLEDFTKRRSIKMVRRLIPRSGKTITLRLPIGYEIETSDDIKIIVEDVYRYRS